MDDEIVDQQDDFSFMLMGRILIDKPIKFNFMKETVSPIWRPGKGMSVREVSSNLFHFHFFHEVDIKRIRDDGPRAYEQSLLVLKKIENHEFPFDVALMKADFWVQIYNLLVGFCSKKIAKAIRA